MTHLCAVVPMRTTVGVVTERRRTEALVKVATALMETPDERHWGYDTAKTAGVRAATLYRVVDRMLADGWVADGWEQRVAGGRPPRRYYTVTDKGRAEMQRLLKEHG